MFLRLVHSVLGTIRKCFLALVSSVIRSKKKAIATEEQWKSEEWEDFSVTVVTNDQEPIRDVTETEDSSKLNEPDIFDDMKPVIKKSKKIRVLKVAEERKTVDFSVQRETQQDTGELGLWNEASSENCWESELINEEGQVVQESIAALKEKRTKERESRQARNALKAQQRMHSGSYSLMAIKTTNQ